LIPATWWIRDSIKAVKVTRLRRPLSVFVSAGDVRQQKQQTTKLCSNEILHFLTVGAG